MLVPCGFSWMVLQQVATTSALDAFQSWPCCHAKTVWGSERKHEASFRFTLGYHWYHPCPCPAPSKVQSGFPDAGCSQWHFLICILCTLASLRETTLVKEHPTKLVATNKDAVTLQHDAESLVALWLAPATARAVLRKIWESAQEINFKKYYKYSLIIWGCNVKGQGRWFIIVKTFFLEDGVLGLKILRL